MGLFSSLQENTVSDKAEVVNNIKSKYKAMPNVIVKRDESKKGGSGWTPTFTLGDASQLEAATNHFAKHVGYIGHEDANGKVILDPKGTIHRGTLHPQPINGKGKFCGVLQYELDTFKILFLNIKVMLKWAREHGKTFMATWFIEWTMLYCGKIWKDQDGNVQKDDSGKAIIVPESWIYFSSTKIKTKVGFWVFRWAKKQDLLVKASKGDKQNTYTNFELVNGAMMQIHDYLSEDVVGEHNWNFALDDIVKKRWENYPTETQKAREQWDFSLNYIGHDRVFVFGTRKFLGDPLEHLEEVLDDLVIDVKTPFVMEGTFPTWKPKTDVNGNEILIAPELHSLEELHKKRAASNRAWMAEEMQDPLALGSKVWDHVNFINTLTNPFVRNYDVFFIYLDRATTTNMKSDYTGCVIGLREFEHEENGQTYCRRIIIDDLTDKISLERLLYKLCLLVDDYQCKYPHLEIIMVVEKQGGGNDFESMIYDRTEYEYVVSDDMGKVLEVKKTPNILRNIRIEMIQSKGDKLRRIEDNLEASLKNERTGVVFLNSLRRSEIVTEILDYPNNDKIDALDALSTGDVVVREVKTMTGGNPYAGVIEAFRTHGQNKGQSKPVDQLGHVVKETVFGSSFEIPKNKYKKKYVFE